MKALTKTIVAVIALTASVVNAAPDTTNYQDAWWNPRTASGMGWNVYQQDKTITISWFHYGNDGADSWRTMSGELRGRVVNGEMFQCYGTHPGRFYDANAQGCDSDGTFRIEFVYRGGAEFDYSSDTLGDGKYELTRYTFRPMENISGLWVSTKYGVGLSQSGDCPEQFIYDNLMIIEQTTFPDGFNVGIELTARVENLYSDDYCEWEFEGTQTGSIATLQGSGECSDGSKPAGTIRNLRHVDGFLTFDLEEGYVNGLAFCREGSKVSAISVDDVEALRQ